MILCRFFRDFVMGDELQELLEATTGRKISTEDLAAAAGKTTSLTREFNRREGLDGSTDTLPKTFFKTSEEGAVLNPDEFRVMLQEYTELRG